MAFLQCSNPKKAGQWVPLPDSFSSLQVLHVHQFLLLEAFTLWNLLALILRLRGPSDVCKTACRWLYVAKHGQTILHTFWWSDDTNKQKHYFLHILISPCLREWAIEFGVDIQPQLSPTHFTSGQELAQQTCPKMAMHANENHRSGDDAALEKQDPQVSEIPKPTKHTTIKHDSSIIEWLNKITTMNLWTYEPLTMWLTMVPTSKVMPCSARISSGVA